MSVIAFNRQIGPVAIDCVLTEDHSSEIEVTKIPIEFGADVTDHAYVLPKVVTLEIADKNAAAAYNALVAFQESRIPFVIVTGLFVYYDMLIKSLDAQRDSTHSYILKATARLDQIIIVGSAMSGLPLSLSSIISSAAVPRGQAGGVKSLRAMEPVASLASGRAVDAATRLIKRGDVASVPVDVTTPQARNAIGSIAP